MMTTLFTGLPVGTAVSSCVTPPKPQKFIKKTFAGSSAGFLDRVAQALYREWFVNFRFPGHAQVKLVASPLGKIPQGWEVAKVKEIVRRLPSGTVYTESDVSDKGKIPVIDQSTSEILGYHDNVGDHRASSNSPIIIFGDHTCKMQILVETFSIGPNIVPFVSENNLPTAYLFFLVHNLVETKEYKRHWTELTNKEVVVAAAELAQSFADIVEPLLLEGRCLRRKNTNLRRTRDLLLPRLLSGQVELNNFAASLSSKL